MFLPQEITRSIDSDKSVDTKRGQLEEWKYVRSDLDGPVHISTAKYGTEIFMRDPMVNGKVAVPVTKLHENFVMVSRQDANQETQDKKKGTMEYVKDANDRGDFEVA